MKLSQSDILRLEQFLDRIRSDTYPEPLTPGHARITQKMLQEIQKIKPLTPGAKILDVGCGQGVALELFTQQGFSPIGITINLTDLHACREKGYDVRDMDQSFLDFPDATFDLVWCRHCLEHSIFPFFTLTQLYRVLKPSGGLYVEVPAPDTTSAHQTNKNHYSVLTRSAWIDLISRIGITPLHDTDIALTTGRGPDVYYAFFGLKPG